MAKNKGENQLNVFDKNGTIHIEWDVFMASNADEEFKNFGELDFEGKELWFSRPNARFDIFELGVQDRNGSKRDDSNMKAFFSTDW